MKTRPLIFCGLLGKGLSRKPLPPLSHTWAELASRSSVPPADTAARHREAGVGGAVGPGVCAARSWPRAGSRGRRRQVPVHSHLGDADGSRRKGERRAALPVPPEANGGGARSLGRPAPQPSGTGPPWSWGTRGGGAPGRGAAARADRETPALAEVPVPLTRVARADLSHPR